MGFVNKIRGFLIPIYSSKTTGLLTILVLVSAVFLTVIVSQQQQTVKQQAAGNSSPIYLSITSDNDGAIGIGDKPQVTVNLINNNTLKKVTALDITINYDSDTLELLSTEIKTVPGSNFTEAFRSQAPDTLHCVLVNLADALTLQGQESNLPVLRLKFDAKKANSGTVSISNARYTTFQGTTAPKIADNTNKSFAYQIYTTRMVASALGSTVNGIDAIIAALESGLQTESNTFTGFGVLNWFNMVQIFKTGTDLKNIDDQIALYTAIRNDMETSGKNIEEILNSYRSFRDSKGKINKAGQNYLDATYGSIPKPGILLQQYDDDCLASIEAAVEEDKDNVNKSETYDCQTRALVAKNLILDFETKEEKIIKNSINPLTLALEAFDKALRNGENVDNFTAEIYYQTAALLQTKTSDDLAVEFYSLVAHNYPGNSRAQDAKDKVAQLTSKGHQAWMLGSELFISLFSVDNFIPIGPIGTTGKAVVKTATAGEKVVLKAALSASKKDSKKVIEVFANMGMEPDKARRIGAVIERIAVDEVPDKTETDALKKEIERMIILSQEVNYTKNEIDILNKLDDLDLRFHMKDDFKFLLNKNPELVNNHLIRKNLLDLLGSGIDKDSAEDLIKHGLDGAKKESANVFILRYIKPKIEDELMPDNVINREEFLTNRFAFLMQLGNKESQFKAAKKTFFNSGNGKYSWFRNVSQFMKSNSNQPWGGKINADKFFAENKAMLYDVRLKAATEARARLLVNLQKFDLSVAKDRQFLANTLNKAFDLAGVKKITADDLIGAEVLTPEKAALLSGTELPPYGIPILVQNKGDYLLRSSLIQSKLNQSTSTAAVQFKGNIKPFSDVGGVIVSTDTNSLLHEATHSYWSITAGESRSIDGRILNEVNSYFIEGRSYLSHIDHYMESLKRAPGFADEETCRELAATAEATAQVLTEAGLSKLQMQNILFNTTEIKELEVYLRMTNAERLEFVKNYPK
jgi:hypothetical protein